MKKIHITGLGLLGGSFALAAKQKFHELEISGWDINEQNLQDAHILGMIDKTQEFPEKDTDLVILATPADTLTDLVSTMLDKAGDGTLVIDLGSTKGSICSALSAHPKRKQYLAGHPIAGTEYSGPRAAFPELLNRKVMILCEMEKTDLHLKEKAYELFDALNLKLRFMEPEEHDKQLAFVSHLSHISSFMLGKTVLQKMEDDKNIFDMAGSGFASTVRLAKSSPAMWAPIFSENRMNILEALDGYIENLQKFRSKISENESDEMKKEMAEINSIRDILDLQS
ncbi:prephenate dehydrogenase [Algoriphagus sediminis]|uniref:Prephenate dehydrogenase n=1 Tax=Algoriphagus sediminis TaxID=3057113 RepID=A0ABT7Y847_9BACT|nr:prephenate dehydrogenase [Algoriphagus sediminis]MDN3202681.1 prephenate dehydrogenase [Algoriphagus sediminis]